MNTWGEAMKAIGALEERVSELEARIPAPEIRTRTRYLDENGAIVDRLGVTLHPNLDRYQMPLPTFERFREIEEAARTLMECPTPMGDAERVRAWVVLEEALKR